MKNRDLPNEPKEELSDSNGSINSERYWCGRFEKDWESLDGPAQSRFFYSLALKYLPAWLITTIRGQNSTICDWGCATGDGTDLLAQTFDVPVTGVDFAEIGIKIAQNRFKKPTFIAENFLTKAVDPSKHYDLLFTSNTLEHFSEPWSVLSKIAKYAKKFIVVLIPYREYDRHHEHEATFDDINIPLSVAQEFHLVYSRVIDTSSSIYWPGEQILLVYANSLQIDRHRLRLADMHIEHQPTQETRELRRKNAELATAKKELEAQVAELSNKSVELAAGKEELEAQVAELSNQSVELAAGKEELEAQVAELSNKSVELVAGKKELEAQVAELSNKSVELVAGKKELEAQVAELSNKSVELSAGKEVLETQLCSISEDMRTKIDRELSRRDALERELHALYSSTSWRLSSPLRLAKQFALHLKRLTWSAMLVVYRAAPMSPRWRRRLRRLVKGEHDVSLASPKPIEFSCEPDYSSVADLSTEAIPTITAAEQVETLFPPLRARQETSDVMVWGIIDWHFRIQRPQHISRGMSRQGYRTFFFSNKFIDSPDPGFHIESLSEDGLLNIVYLNVAGSPSIYSSAPSGVTGKALSASLSVFISEAKPRSVISILQHPFWFRFADGMPNRHLIYDMMDHHEGFGDGATDLLELEDRILREADRVIVTSDFLQEIAQRKNNSVLVVRNACDYDHFAIQPESVFVDPHGRRVIGYYGAIAHWFDADLVKQIAQRFPQHLILLVGADSVGVEDQLKNYPNIQFTGEVKYDHLPHFLHGFDVCLLPFKIIPLTLATNPVKIYEYLSAAKPIVSVNLPEIAQFAGLVKVGQTTEQFFDLIEEALSNALTKEEISERQNFASKQTWKDRSITLANAIDEFLPPRVSIIVVTYNKVALTDACLRSIEINTSYKNYEVIVVDNASKDQTPEYLARWASLAGNRTIILNEDNLGFAAANNQGLRYATGEYCVLLNNDTYVTPGWLGTLIQHLKRDPTLGLVGPVTNSIGNEAKINIQYVTMSEMEHAALEYTSSHMGELYPLSAVAFFCVAFARSLYERIGPLDEAFGIGLFEDDDYCRRVEAIGLHLACADDVFVHHHHSASFNDIGAEHRQALFLANQNIFEKKWGPWTPHTYSRKSQA